MQQPVGSGGGFLDWFQESVMEVGNAAKAEYIRNNFPERIVDDSQFETTDAQPRNVDEEADLAQQNRNLLVMGGAALVVGLLAAALFVK